MIVEDVLGGPALVRHETPKPDELTAEVRVTTALAV